ncbi:MAG: NAD-dependent epimerase/dehydratase family protein [Lachnospiraceae bacterium]|nr:NAD-dependent epimerase/dehydratase family protein [Lachnospiraceae bacterium]
MKILVIGGSYFLGRAFVEAASRIDEVTLINRGNKPIGDNIISGGSFGYEQLSRITEIVADRHDEEALRNLAKDEYDVVVDFCAYSADDIRLFVDNANVSFKQYIYISTTDVYMRGTGAFLDETAPYETKDYGGEAGLYILGKIAAEQELKEISKDRFAYTIIRPAFIYGPNNYAPREGIYFNWIKKAGQIIHPLDSTGYFQMVYVKDLAWAVLKLCGNESAFEECINICDSEKLTYDAFAQILGQVTRVDFAKAGLRVEEINERGIPLPFPLTEEESEYYVNTKSESLGIEYTDIVKGMTETYDAWLKEPV